MQNTNTILLEGLLKITETEFRKRQIQLEDSSRYKRSSHDAQNKDYMFERGLIASLAAEYHLPLTLLQFLAHNTEIILYSDKSKDIKSKNQTVTVVIKDPQRISLEDTDIASALKDAKQERFRLGDSKLGDAQLRLRAAIYAFTAVANVSDSLKKSRGSDLFEIYRCKEVDEDYEELLNLAKDQNTLTKGTTAPFTGRNNITIAYIDKDITNGKIGNITSILELIGTKFYLERRYAIAQEFITMIDKAKKESGIPENMLVGLNRTIEFHNRDYICGVIGPYKRLIRKLPIETVAKFARASVEDTKKAIGILTPRSDNIASMAYRD